MFIHHGGGGWITHNEIWDTQLAGIEVAAESSTSIVEGNLIHHSRGAGIFVHLDGGYGVIQHNTVMAGDGEGIVVTSGSQASARFHSVMSGL